MNWILIIVILALIALIGWQEWNNRKERAKLVNAVIAKNAQEASSMDLADKTKVDDKPTDPSIIYPQESENISEDVFDKIIENQNV
jgi:predicted negative regulator of RcsB-dependent stress response